MEEYKDILNAQKGDPDAFARLIHRHKQAMYRIVRSYGMNESDSGDVLQEAVIRAYRSIKRLKEPRFFTTWLTRIVINEVRRFAATRKPHEELSKTYAGMTDPVADHQSSLEVQEAIASLDDELKEIVLLFYMEDISTKDIARLLETPEGTVKSRLFRARSKLGAFLNPKSEGSLCHD